MKIVVIGASGTIGRSLSETLAKRHEVVRVAHTQGDHRVDITSKESLERLFEAVAPFDAVACAAGDARFKPLNDLTDEDFAVGLESKLMGASKPGSNRTALHQRQRLLHPDQRHVGRRASAWKRSGQSGQRGVEWICPCSGSGASSVLTLYL